jgi:excisionase family DNA binding protein
VSISACKTARDAGANMAGTGPTYERSFVPKSHAAAPSTAKNIEGNDLYSGLLKTPELAEAINLSPRSIQYLAKRRAIPYLKIGKSVRFRLADVLKALERFTVKEVSIR